ncbi:MAG: PEP-CTERM-box response regulator transcription factor [Deltaproteobacteria bacterium]|nr:PEP-CTERM-box response regulator transcription factor [Deltaproteobacteria bacterium]
MPDTLPPTPDPLHPSLDRLLIVDDNEEIRTQLKWALVKDYEVFVAGDRSTALEVFESQRPAVMTLDLGLPPLPQDVEEGFETLGAVLQKDPATKVIVITGRDEREHALRAVGQGAYDYFCKPIQIEELKVVLRRAYHLSRLEREHRELLRRVAGDSFEGMLGASPQIQEVFAAIRKVATTDAPVLTTGESGSGKELVARAIHRQSARRDGAFVAINCGAIPDTLLESELFGHEKGAFTGAHIQRKGRIETAQGGTLFLDEIGELSPLLQVKLLRFLQEHRIERLGGREEIQIDVRVIAATNTDLKQAMNNGRFREDLYYRLGVVIISVPPLRERQGDISLLAKAMLSRFSVENGNKITGFTAGALRALETHSWPGNIRELENRIRRAVVMAEGSKLTPDDLQLDGGFSPTASLNLREAREALERTLVQRALMRNKGRLTQAAADLGISRPTLYELMEKLGIGKK